MILDGKMLVRPMGKGKVLVMGVFDAVDFDQQKMLNDRDEMWVARIEPTHGDRFLVHDYVKHRSHFEALKVLSHANLIEAIEDETIERIPLI